MQWIPELSIRLFNGWILFIVYMGVMLIQPLFYPNSREIMERLMIHPRDTLLLKRIMPPTIFLYYVMLILSVFLPIRAHRVLLYSGLVLFGISMILYGFSVHAFAVTPLNKPVTKGLYRISRNPIHFFSWIAYYGVGIATGSWLIILLNTLTAVGMHISTLAEERYCLNRYGESYRQYMKSVPRYFLFF